MKRTEAIAPTPIFVSQLTCEAVLGIDSRRYLEMLREHHELSVVQRGKLRLVEVASVRELLRGLATTTAAPAPSIEAELETADEVLAALGRKRSA